MVVVLTKSGREDLVDALCGPRNPAGQFEHSEGIQLHVRQMAAPDPQGQPVSNLPWPASVQPLQQGSLSQDPLPGGLWPSAGFVGVPGEAHKTAQGAEGAFLPT